MHTTHPTYSRTTLETLAWLESCTDNLGELLESYRYLQPDGQEFSPETIKKISELHSLAEKNGHNHKK